jgi:hypothetical protein
VLASNLELLARQLKDGAGVDDEPGHCHRRRRTISAAEGGISPSRGRWRQYQMLATIHGAPNTNGRSQAQKGVARATIEHSMHRFKVLVDKTRTVW